MTAESSVPVSKAALWGGRVASWLPALFLLMDGAMKLAKPEFVVKATVDLGFPESSIFGMGVALCVATILYLVPKTAVLGAILVTGYLGGAVATHVHHSDPTWEIVFPVFFGVLLWGGLFLRDRRVRALIPFVD